MRTILSGLIVLVVILSLGCSAVKASSGDAGRRDMYGGKAGRYKEFRERKSALSKLANWDIGERRTINWDGLERIYYVHIPPGLDPDTPAPLALNFHGGGSSAREQAWYSGMIRKSSEEGFIAVHPEAVERYGYPRWNGGPHANRLDVDDVGFVGAMLDALEAEYNIDASRVFATGISSGGFMSYRLACEMSSRIAAIAPVAAMIDCDCAPSEPVAVIHFHGTDDQGCPYNGGKGALLNYSFESVDDTIEFWIENNQCADEYEITYQLGDATCYTYTSSVGADVVLCIIDGGGHTWPGVSARDAIHGWDTAAMMCPRLI